MLIDGAEKVGKGLKAAVMLVHHTTKNGEAERGSSVLRGAVDTMLDLSCSNEIIRLTCAKQKDAEPFSPLRLQLAPVGASCVVRKAPDVATGRQADALVLLAGTGSVGMTHSDWLEATELPDTTFQRYRRALLKGGLVREVEGRYCVTDAGLASLIDTASATG